MKMIKSKGKIWIVLLFTLMAGIILSGCKGGEKLIEEKIPVKLSESQLREYNYALTEATKQKLFGNFKQAAALYMKCIEVNPQSDAAYFQLSGLYMINRQTDEAIKLNRKASRLNPDNYWYKIQLAQLYLITQRADSASIIYEEVLKKWPEKIEIKYELSRIYSESGKTKRGLQLLDEIEAENGISEPVSMLKEQIYVQQGEYDLAIRELNKLIEVKPDDIRYLGILAELYTTLERNEDAKDTYRKIFEIEPENGIAQLSMAEFYRLNGEADKQFDYLELAFRNNSLPVDRKMGVIIDFLTNEEVFRENENELDSLIGILSSEYPDDFRVKTARADLLSKQEKYEAALSVYNEVLEAQKGNYFIWEQTIFIENILGNTENVYEKCSEALEYFPDKPFLYMFLGNSAMQMGKNDEAIVSLEKGLEYVENNIPLTVQFYSFLAEAWRNMEDYRKSDEYFEKALQMEPDNIVILNNYGYYLSLRGVRLEKAEKMSRKTIRMEPENPTYLDTYAWILFKSGKVEQALEYIEKAIESGGGQDPDILEHYGDILNALGMEEQARENWQKALENGGSADEINEKLKK
jgi:tetratricopeptide (TPR) repeat protein